jgi:formate-dependent nitrite reductase membrane component NrfD
MTTTRPTTIRDDASRDRYTKRRRREQLMVPRAEFQSYYGRPIIKRPTWSARDVASYLFLGGTAGASSTLAAAAQLSGRPALARAAKVSAAAAIGGSLYALVHDLGRPTRFLNMLRVIKPTSPMSIGSWLLAAYAPQAGLAAATDLTDRFLTIGKAATLGAGIMGPAIATYTAPLIADTAVPTWHDAHRELPFLFAASAACSASGLALILAPPDETGPARRLALAAAISDAAATRAIHRRLGPEATPLTTGRPGALMRVAGGLTAAGATLAQLFARRSRTASVIAGTALVAGSACTRFGIFLAGARAADDPGYTVRPQRARLEAATDEQGTAMA